MIAIHQHEIPDHFPDDVLFEAEQARAVELGERTDLRNLPLFTIDPSDARDHDDAICAKPDDDSMSNASNSSITNNLIPPSLVKSPMNL